MHADLTAPTHAIGIDVGGTTIKAIVASRAGEVVDSWQVPTPQDGPEAVVRAVADLERSIRSSATAGEVGLAEALTVAVPGIVDEVSGIAALSVNLGWRDFPMREALSDAVGRPVALAHDVRSGALGESWWGAGGATFMYVPVGTGIASAVMIDGEPLLPHPWSGEIGQIPVAEPGLPGSPSGAVAPGGAAVGSSVPLERVASASAIARRMREIDPDFSEDAGAREVFERAAAGDGGAARVIDDALSTLATALMTAIHVLGPIPIVIGGGLAGAGEALTEPLARYLTPPGSILPPPDIRVAKLGTWSQALGTAARSFDMS